MDLKTLKVLEFNKITAMLADETSFEMSRELALKIAPAKTYDEAVILRDRLTCAVKYVYEKGAPQTGGLKDLSMPLKRIEKGGILNAAELMAVGRALKIARGLIAYAEQGDALDEYFCVLTSDRAIEGRIYDAIESEEEIADGASAELAAIRRRIRDAHGKIREHLNTMIHSARYQKYLQEAIVTVRDGRYVVPVKAEHRSEVGGIVHDMSSTGSTVFIEPNAVVNENNKLKELAAKEKAEIEKILAELTELVGTVIHPLFVNQRQITELDLVFAKAKLAVKMNAVVPLINEKNYVRIVNGRHPLINSQTVVPVSVNIGDEFQTLVITGPNTGGKTVTLKTLGLFCLMAASGMGIPAADGTDICVFENIFADIGDEQSIEQSLSTFSAHMTNIVDILNKVSSGSLVLFDELGAGTDPDEGAALAISILKYAKDMGAITAATTHYSEIKLYALTADGVENASCEFDVNSLRPTYRLLIGIPGKSNAFAISKRLGLPEFIIQNAARQLTEENVRFEDVISGLEENRRVAEQERLLAAKYKLEIEQMKKELESESIRLDNTRKKLTENANREAKRILENAKADAKRLIADIRSIRREQTEQQANRAMNDAIENVSRKIKEREKSDIIKQKTNTEVPKNLIPGNTVEILDIGQTGTVVTKPKPDGTVCVLAGVMKINTNISNLRLKAGEKKPVTATVSRGGGIRTDSVKPEIDLRGMMLEDALFVVDKYLDDVSFSGLNRVTIIHGKGTGVLRKGIHDLLKRHPHAASYRLGAFGEGEAGVTIVEIK